VEEAALQPVSRFFCRISEKSFDKQRKKSDIIRILKRIFSMNTSFQRINNTWQWWWRKPAVAGLVML